MVPKQHGTGGKVTMMRITKNGDRSLRTLLIHGARAVMNWASRRDDAMGRWIMALKALSGAARTIVALANTTHRDVGSTATRRSARGELARIGWAVLRGENNFDVNKAFRPKAAKQATASA